MVAAQRARRQKLDNMTLLSFNLNTGMVKIQKKKLGRLIAYFKRKSVRLSLLLFWFYLKFYSFLNALNYIYISLYAKLTCCFGHCRWRVKASILGLWAIILCRCDNTYQTYVIIVCKGKSQMSKFETQKLLQAPIGQEEL